MGSIVARIEHYEIEAIGAARLGAIEQRNHIRLNGRVGNDSLRLAPIIDDEPPRVCRRLVGLSYAAMAGCSSMA
jgi:hypothetical protein